MSPTLTKEAHSLVARYGSAIVSRTIATIPALVLRWQAALDLRDEHVVTIAYILSYYSSPPTWPSVSIDAMVKSRGISRARVERTLKDLEAKGYLSRPRRDPKYRSWVMDLSGLLAKLTPLVEYETARQGLRAEQVRLERAALLA